MFRTGCQNNFPVTCPNEGSISLRQRAGKQHLRSRVFDLASNHPAKRARSVKRIKSARNQCVQSIIIRREMNARLFDASGNRREHFPGNLPQIQAG